MQKPSALQKTYKIAGILFAAGLGIQCCLAVLTFPLPLFNNGYPVELSGSELAVFFIQRLMYLPLMILGFLKSKEPEITLPKAKNTAVLLPLFVIGETLLNLAISVLAARMQWIGVDFNIVSNLLVVFGYLLTAGTLLLFCAAAAELYAALPRKNPGISRRLSLFGMIGLGSCVLLKTIGVLLIEQLSFLYVSRLPELALKWKLLLLAIEVPGKLLPAIVAAWSYFDTKVTSGRALTKIILTPVLYYIAEILSEYFMRFLFAGVSATEGADVLAALNIARSLASMPNLLAYAGLILVLCAGAIEYYQVKNPSADGE